jgi:tripartite-type tricarboxylate transporter receptor subunit TctC
LPQDTRNELVLAFDLNRDRHKTRMETMRRRDVLQSGAALAATIALRPAAWAQGKYPSNNIRLVVPYPPGGVVDVVACHWAEHIKRTLGTVVVENQPGGGGLIGANAVVRANPDGYTLLFGETSCLIIAPSLMAQPPYDPVKSFSPVSMIATSSTSVVVHPDVPAKNLEEFIKYAKANQDKVSYGSAGTGTVTHLAGESFKQLIGATGILHVPYRGAGPALVDVMAGVIPMTTPNITSQILDLHRSGKVRILAICAPSRLKVAPDIPAANEILPDLVIQLTAGVVAPAGTPEPIIAQLAETTAQIVKSAEFEQALESSGLQARADSSAAGAKAFLVQEREHLLPIIKAAGLQSH